jgi:DNA-directed RNA polymerase specialized sigma24 family protein
MAVLLYYRQELQITDIATVLGVTSGTVKTMLFRARKKLRATMNDGQPTRAEVEEDEK